MTMKREFTAEDSAHLARLRDLTEELSQHHRAACDAHAAGNKADLGSALIRGGRAIRSMQVEHARWAGDAMQADQTATQTVQTSNGTANSDGSENGRGMHPLMTGDIGGFVARVFPRKAK
jgi:hypothetical protein